MSRIVVQMRDKTILSLALLFTVSQGSLLNSGTPVNYCGNGTNPMAPIVVSADPGSCTWLNQKGINIIQPPTIDNTGSYNPSKSGTPEEFGREVSVTPTIEELEGITYAIGTTNVEFTAKDKYGRVNSCVVPVVVEDTELPQWSQPAGSTSPLLCGSIIKLQTEKDKCTAFFKYALPIATDNCKVLTPQTPSHPAEGFNYPAGMTVVEYKVLDSAANAAKCEFHIDVKDIQAPTITCDPEVISVLPNNIGIDGKGQCTDKAMVNYKCVAADNCEDKQTFSCNIPTGSQLGVGSYKITCDTTDQAGHKSSFTIDAKVDDRSPPVFLSCPSAPITHTIMDGDSFGPMWQIPKAVDNSCEPPTVSESKNRKPGDFMSPGSHQITYTATDKSGNSAPECTFLVTVIDHRAPTINNCPTKNIVVAADMHATVARATWTAINATDTNGNLLVAQNIDKLPKSGMHFHVGINPVEFKFKSLVSGKESSCQFSVIVNDAERPVPLKQATDTSMFKCTKSGEYVKNHRQCGGLFLTLKSRNGHLNNLGDVVPYSGPVRCCNDNFECRGDDMYKACLPKV
eukprot:jgi/Bigna1/89048/estExt_fgenesh1_pg.C_430007